MCLMVLLYLRREMGEEYVPYGAALSQERDGRGVCALWCCSIL